MRAALQKSKLMKMFVVSARRSDCELPWPFEQHLEIIISLVRRLSLTNTQHL